MGTALRPELAGAVDEIINAVRAQVPEYSRPLEGRFGRRITEGVSVALAQFVDLLGAEAAAPSGPQAGPNLNLDTRVYRALGQLEHREGRTLAALQLAYQVGTRTAWRRIGGGPTARHLPPEVVFELAEALFTYMEQLSAASVEGWANEEARRAGSVHTHRHALVKLLAGSSAAAADVERLAAAAGWRLPARLAALVTEDAAAVAARLPGAVGADLDPVGVALVAIPEQAAWTERVRAAVRDRPAVLGPVVGWARAHRSVERALAAWPLQVDGLLGPGSGLGDNLVHADDHLLALLLAAAPETAGDLADRALAPLARLPAGAAARAEETLRAWLDAHGDVSATAAALHVHPQTVRYRLAGLRDTFDGALDDPAARLELAVALRHRAPPSGPSLAR